MRRCAAYGASDYGGSRTVDVHVRGCGAPLGPSSLSAWKTVRGVGYLWNA